MPDINNHYKIKFTGLKLGVHSFRFQLENLFFESYEFSEITDASIIAEVELEKMNNMMVLKFHLKGMVNSLCDRCQDPLKINLNFDDKLIVKFGEETNDTDDEVLILGPSEYELDLSQYLYEYAHLSLPAKKVHKNTKDCNQEILDQFYYIPDDEKEEKEENTDPRWDQLKKLK